MKIGILVWGSLYWDPRNLNTTGEWFFDGPILPIEFSRISGGNRLTLVITPGFDNVTTLFAISGFDRLSAATEKGHKTLIILDILTFKITLQMFVCQID